jgi:hypothetical protein
MTPNMLRGIGIGCVVLGLILGFVGWERYQANADNVAAMKKMMGNFPMGDMLGGVQEMQPGMPTASKYALFFGVLSLAGGVACLVMARRAPAPSWKPPAPGPGELGG